MKCQSLLMEQMNAHYNFSKNEIIPDDDGGEADDDNDLLMGWFRLYGDIDEAEYSFIQNDEDIFPPHPRKSNFYNSYERKVITSVYLLSGDESVVDSIKSKGSILVGKVGEEMSILNRLLLEDTEERLVNIQWDTYLPPLPITDIIIGDNHYFNDEIRYKRNNENILKSLITLAKKTPINILIVVKTGEVCSTIDLPTEVNNIKGIIKSCGGSNDSHVTICKTRKQHDRQIVTNYYRINCGTSVQNQDAGVKEDSKVEIKTNANRHNQKITNEEISFYQNVINGDATIIGDRKCNFLNFS